MQALYFESIGSLQNLKLVETAIPVPGPDELLIQVKAAAINPSDIKSLQGKMQETTAPRIPGRDFAGIVVSNSQKWKGKSVFGTGGVLGFSKDGTHAEYVAVPENGLVEIPNNITFSEAAAMSLSYVTAWQSIINAGKLKPQETILITGAAGAVGSAAVRIALALGAKVIGTYITSNEIPKDLANSLQWINLDNEKLPDALQKLTNNKGANVVFDVIGGALFEACNQCLASKGRQIAIASYGPPIVGLNLIEFYHKEAQLIGVDTLKMTSEECAKILKDLIPGIEKGIFIPQEMDELSLKDAPAAYEAINNRKAKHKKIIIF